MMYTEGIEQIKYLSGIIYLLSSARLEGGIFEGIFLNI